MSGLLVIFRDVLIPVFAVVGFGAFAGRRWNLGHEALAAVAFRLLMPAFIFRLLSDPAAVEGPIGRMVAASLGTVLVVWATMAVLTRNATAERRTLDAMSAAFGNVGNLGFPVVLFAFGAEALASAGIHFLAVTVGSFVLSVVAAARVRSGSPVVALRRAVTTPAIAATVPAVVVALMEIDVPVMVARPVDLLADAVIPVMLLTLGIQLQKSTSLPEPRRVAPILGAKLILSPVVFAALANVVGLSGQDRHTGLVLAGMPTAVLVGLIALEFDLEAETATTVVLASSLVSILTLGVVLTVAVP